MTTVERFRRRQRIEGALVLIVGIFSVASGVHFNQVQQDQQQCFEENFAEFTATTKVRSNLTNQQLDQFKRLIDGALTSKTPQEFKPVKKEYLREAERIARIKERHPLQEYPTGTCDGTIDQPRKHTRSEANLPWKPFSLS